MIRCEVFGMKAFCLFLLGISAFAAHSASAQISVYAEGSADQMTNLITSHTAFGTTFGVQGEVYRHKAIRIGGDVRGFFYDGSGVEFPSTRLQLGGAGIGPKVSLAIKRVEPYAEFLVGFARYNSGLGQPTSSTTDSQVDGVFGLDLRLTQRFDYRVFEFDYKRYSALGGEFNPKVFSTGVVFHFGKR
jgi:hypothetical protein